MFGELFIVFSCYFTSNNLPKWIPHASISSNIWHILFKDVKLTGKKSPFVSEIVQLNYLMIAPNMF